MKTICVLGLGYIGLPTAATLASNGFKVIGVDINEKIISLLKNSEIHIEEPHLDELVKSIILDGHFIPSETPKKADVFIIAVPTPKTDDNSCELKYVIQAAKSIVPHLNIGNTVILESTVSPGTTEEMIKPILEESGLIVGENIYLAHCPERVLPGNIIHEIINNDRIIGGYTEICAKKAMEIYKSFVKGNIILTDLKTAEMAKLVENIFRDVNIALANELVKICDELKINAAEVIRLANKHPRVSILKPGPGVGGHCLAIDPYYVISKTPETARLISTAREINCSMPEFIVSKVMQLVNDIETPKIAVFGITYKENIDDLRESPAIEIVKQLKEKGLKVNIYDPHVKIEVEDLANIDTTVTDSDMILILVAHDEFTYIDYKKLSEKMRRPFIFDVKKIINKDEWDIPVKYLGEVF